MKNFCNRIISLIAPAGVVSLVAILFVVSVGLRAQAPVADSPAIEAKAKALLSKLTLEQKIELLGGVNDMYTRPMPNIGLTRLKMSDGPEGVRTWGPTTAYPAGAALAATWDTEMARKIGQGFDAMDVHAASTFSSVPESTSAARPWLAATLNIFLRTLISMPASR